MGYGVEGWRVGGGEWVGGREWEDGGWEVKGV